MKSKRAPDEDPAICDCEERTPSIYEVMDKKPNIVGLARANEGELGRQVTELLRVGLPPHPRVHVDEDRFITLLGLSRSLSLGEKLRIARAFGQLTQEQVDRLVDLFVEERQKLAVLTGRAPA